jgi:hypothetical protein
MEVYSESKLRELFRNYQCPWCESADLPAGLTMHSYDHSGGVAVLQHDRSIAYKWVYGVCDSCEQQWSFGKLRSAYQYSYSSAIQTEDF